ncbi:MAG: ATP synthase F1 subunit delta [Deltaproteobacteria bacterium]|nr:ATP synthase F1 subunit delta [Deltaproteobacteria bacterium]
MKKTYIARRYARALIEIGKEEKRVKEIGRELRDLKATFSGSPELYKVLLNPLYKMEERKGIVERVCENLDVSPDVKRFISLLVENRHIKVLDNICDAYFMMEDELEGRIRAKVEAPEVLDDTLIAVIRERLQGMTGKEVILSVDKNLALIGGLVVKVGNLILDGSIKGQLEKMRTRLKNYE